MIYDCFFVVVLKHVTFSSFFLVLNISDYTISLPAGGGPPPAPINNGIPGPSSSPFENDDIVDTSLPFQQQPPPQVGGGSMQVGNMGLQQSSASPFNFPQEQQFGQGVASLIGNQPQPQAQQFPNVFGGGQQEQGSAGPFNFPGVGAGGVGPFGRQ